MYLQPAAITMVSASASLAGLQRSIDAGESEIDLSAMAHSDSAAVAVLLAALRHAQQAGRSLRFVGAPPSLQSLAKLYGVEGLMGPAAAASPAESPAASPAASSFASSPAARP